MPGSRFLGKGKPAKETLFKVTLVDRLSNMRLTTLFLPSNISIENPYNPGVTFLFSLVIVQLAVLTSNFAPNLFTFLISASLTDTLLQRVTLDFLNLG